MNSEAGGGGNTSQSEGWLEKVAAAGKGPHPDETQGDCE
jgi:hypothetical protein